MNIQNNARNPHNVFITNLSKFDVATGLHEDVPVRSVLIQILEVGEKFPEPKFHFQEIHQFHFDDIEEDTAESISQDQADAIALILQRGLSEGFNVFVHCFAGLCRSGAVVEIGVEMGFNPPDKIRLPNTLVMKKLKKALGIEINENTSVFATEFLNREFD